MPSPFDKHIRKANKDIAKNGLYDIKILLRCGAD